MVAPEEVLSDAAIASVIELGSVYSLKEWQSMALEAFSARQHSLLGFSSLNRKCIFSYEIQQ